MKILCSVALDTSHFSPCGRVMEQLKIELWFKVQMDRDLITWGEGIVRLPAVRQICMVLSVVTFVCGSVFYMKTRVCQ